MLIGDPAALPGAALHRGVRWIIVTTAPSATRSAPGRCPSSRQRVRPRRNRLDRPAVLPGAALHRGILKNFDPNYAPTGPQRSWAPPSIEAARRAYDRGNPGDPQRSRALPFIEAGTAWPRRPTRAARSAPGRCPSSRRGDLVVADPVDTSPQRSRALPFIEACGNPRASPSASTRSASGRWPSSRCEDAADGRRHVPARSASGRCPSSRQYRRPDEADRHGDP